MKKALSLILAIGVLCAALVAQDVVDKAELTPAKGDLAFINYEGPHAVIDSLAAIKAIGEGPGRVVSSSLAKAATAGDRSRYYVIHAVGPADDKGLRDADIVFLGAGSGVDHIRNLRLILQGYLEEAYGYSAADAAVLAKYVTIYNAVYRGNLDYFKGKYKPLVLGYLSRDKAGLSLDWKEWAGKSQIIIPLSAKAGEKGHISAVDTGPITDPAVKASIGKEPDKGIPDAIGMVAIKEKEADKAKDEAAKAADKAAADKTAADKAKDEAAKAADKAAADKVAADKAAEAAKPKTTEAGTPALVDPAAKTAADKAKETATASEKAATEADKTATDKAKAAETSAAEADKAASDAAAKEAEALKEREAIAAAQKAKIAEDAAAAEAASSGARGVGLKLVDSSYPFYAKIVSFDSVKGTTLKESALDTIRARSLLGAGADYVAIAGKKEGTGAVRLIIIDGTSLEMKSQGDDDIYGDSVLVEKGGFYYAVVETPGGLFLGKFDKALKLAAVSEKAVLGITAVGFSDKGVIVQDSSGAFMLLGLTDLKTSLTIK